MAEPKKKAEPEPDVKILAQVLKKPRAEKTEEAKP